MATPELRIEVLGSLRMAHDGTPFRFHAVRKVAPLLLYVVLHRKSAIPRDLLAFTLWPDDEEENALANLRRHVYLLGKALPPSPAKRPWLVVDAGTIQWNPAAATAVDVEEFEQLAQRAETLESAAELYAGDLGEGLYEEWLFAER